MSLIKHLNSKVGKVTPEYRSWLAMKSRCYYSKNIEYKNYGARGITVCEEWRNSFEKFLEDMGEKPDKSYTLDRIDNSQNYCKDNCKWSSKIEQSNNTRKNVFIEYNGEKLTLAQWSEKLGINKQTLKTRYNQGWSIEKMFSTTNSKMTENVKLKILELNKQDYTLKQISEQVGFSQQAISKYLKKKNETNN